jgi:hypothetical protein
MVACCVLLLASAPHSSPAPQEDGSPTEEEKRAIAGVAKWEKFDFAKSIMKPAEIKKLTPLQLKFLRGIVFGRHGRVFKEPIIHWYLVERPWYKPSDKYHVSQLNDNERKNMDVIKEAEFRRHKFVEPGDLKFHRNRALTEKELGKHSRPEWRIMRSEVEAIHGKTFPDEPWLQSFFDERYWYQPNAKYDPKQLSGAERKNLATLATAERKQHKLALAPGDMEIYQSKAVTPEMLKGLGLYELRLLRNEIYARRGRLFRTAWIQMHFYGEEWYTPLPDNKEPTLSAIEQKNSDTIVKHEQKLHEELSTQPIDKKFLEGLFLEDARKLRYEIYARRGEVFKDKWLAKYFGSFDWYKPDPKFRESFFTEIERKNVATIRVYEKKSVSVMRAMAA